MQAQNGILNLKITLAEIPLKKQHAEKKTLQGRLPLE